jgi:hypothetical protein
MNFGFNSNVRVGDALYHVQTEDRGASHPFLDTVVYMAGRVVFKRSASYEKFASSVEPGTLAQKLHEELARRHREVIAQLEAGTLPLHTKEKVELRVEDAGPRDGLNLRLANSKSWLAAGNVSLEIELTEKNTKHRVGDADVEAVIEHEKKRTPCAEGRTDAKGCATLRFPMPPNVVEGASLVIRATDGSNFGEMRFRLKLKLSHKTPAPVSR